MRPAAGPKDLPSTRLGQLWPHRHLRDMLSADCLDLSSGPAQIQALWGCNYYGSISYKEGLALFLSSNTTPPSSVQGYLADKKTPNHLGSP